MTKRKAIAIIIRQKAKISQENPFYSYNWLIQTKTYIRAFFGEDSHEYERMKEMRFTTYKDEKGNETNNTNLIEKFLDDCIETINDGGIKKREWKHILVTTHPALFWSIFWALFIAGVTLAFWAGQLTANKSDSTPKQQTTQENDSTHNPKLQ